MISSVTLIVIYLLENIINILTLYALTGRIRPVLPKFQF